ncbi:MAG: hypothetical protein QM731_04790 [Chitinophagaceae bacterium]
MQQSFLTPILAGDLEAWNGLPKQLPAEELLHLLGTPLQQQTECLGYYPADKWIFDIAGRTIYTYIREKKVVMVEIPQQSLPAITAWPSDPCGILPHQLLYPEAYAHEYIYCTKGLQLTIARFFQHQRPDEVIRCRGFVPVASVLDFGPYYYKAFEDEDSY